MLGLFAGLGALPQAASAQGVLQCAPYARSVSGIDIHGNAGTWWNQAAGVYARGKVPAVGSVLVFSASRAMRVGHVAMVGKVIDSRHVLLNHANWSGPGRIERAALAVDVSPNGDWSEVRVWHAGTGTLGLRVNPAYGFIYKGEAPQDDAPLAAAPTVLAAADLAGDDADEALGG